MDNHGRALLSGVDFKQALLETISAKCWPAAMGVGLVDMHRVTQPRHALPVVQNMHCSVYTIHHHCCNMHCSVHTMHRHCCNTYCSVDTMQRHCCDMHCSVHTMHRSGSVVRFCSNHPLLSCTIPPHTAQFKLSTCCCCRT